MKEPYPLCRKYGVVIDQSNGYVSWDEWKRWRYIPENKALMDKVPAYATAVTVCEWGIPACDVEVWLGMATGTRTMHEID